METHTLSPLIGDSSLDGQSVEAHLSSVGNQSRLEAVVGERAAIARLWINVALIPKMAALAGNPAIRYHRYLSSAYQRIPVGLHVALSSMYTTPNIVPLPENYSTSSRGTRGLKLRFPSWDSRERGTRRTSQIARILFVLQIVPSSWRILFSWYIFYIIFFIFRW